MKRKEPQQPQRPAKVQQTAAPQPRQAGPGSDPWTRPISFGTPLARACHHPGYDPVFRVGALAIHAARQSTLPRLGGLVLDCTGAPDTAQKEDVFIALPPGYEDARDYAQHRKILAIDWPDGGEPGIKPGFWRWFIERALSEREERIIVCCIGSHGRTGTALACLAIAGLGMSGPDAVQLVRKAHCERAIESLVQIEYIDEVWHHYGPDYDATAMGEVRPSHYFGGM